MASKLIDRRFIEEAFPVKEVSRESIREKGIRRGHISALHIWWARRPLAASRATVFSSLIPISRNQDEKNAMLKFIANLSRWESASDMDMIGQARAKILASSGTGAPRVLDPFAGGGSIPLESLRLGCLTYAGDYNPVASLILKCMLEYPFPKNATVEDNPNSFAISRKNDLLDEVRTWGEWVLSRTRDEIGKFYPNDAGGSIPVGYIWARTIPCQNPSCGGEIPLIKQFWLAKKAQKRVALCPVVANKTVTFKIVGSGYEKMPSGFNPDRGTISKAIVTCPVCGTVVDARTTRNLFENGRSGERLIAVVLCERRGRGKSYRVVENTDLVSFAGASEYLRKIRAELTETWGFDPVPNEPLPHIGTLGFRVQRYGFRKWGDLFNDRQKLALVMLVGNVRFAHETMTKERGYDEERARIITAYLTLIMSRCSDFESSMVRWFNHVENSSNTFARQTVNMTWDYFELNPFSTASQGTYASMMRQVTKAMEFLFKPTIGTTATVTQASATQLPYSDGTFDAVFTDPPYYDNVPYSHLSDFFYVWQKRAIGDIFPELFATSLTPKSEEIVAYLDEKGNPEKGRTFFEDSLKKSFSEISRVLTPNGIALIVYAHKSTAGWETLVNALLDSGLVITATWPIHTEMVGRLRARESAALASSIYIVARKLEKIHLGLYKDVKEDLSDFLESRMDQLWKDGIIGADFLVAAIGSSVQVFGEYERVIREDSTVRADTFLDDVRRIVTDYAIKQVLHNGLASEISGLTRFYVLWRWAYGEDAVIFDDARKLAQVCGIDLTSQWGKTFIQKDKEIISVLGPYQRRFSDIESLDTKDMIDIMHMALLLWEKGNKNALIDLLRDTGYGSKDAFKRVAQAIAETLPKGTKEKLLLEGFLNALGRLGDEVREGEKQTRLFE